MYRSKQHRSICISMHVGFVCVCVCVCVCAGQMSKLTSLLSVSEVWAMLYNKPMRGGGARESEIMHHLYNIYIHQLLLILIELKLNLTYQNISTI